MIDLKELRIGNLVNEEGLGNCRVVGIKEHSVWLGANNVTEEGLHNVVKYRINQEHLSPIPLTPEILEKAGFKKDYSGFSLPDKMSLSFSVTKDGDLLACWLDRSTGVTVRHLHHLQNLHYSLTGVGNKRTVMNAT